MPRKPTSRTPSDGTTRRPPRPPRSAGKSAPRADATLKRKKRAAPALPRAERAPLEIMHKERERVAKVVARAGLGSRREVEEWIAAGRVAVNGVTLEEPGVTVGPEDRITVDGVALPEKERTRLFLFHKPRGLVTTTDDPEGRPTVFDMLPAGLPRLVSVGRLDFNSEGLLLLTNDGGLARLLELPETGWLRRYRARAFGEVTQDQLDKLRAGLEVEGFRYGPMEASLDREQGSNVWITVALREGKKREIRTVLGALGVHVNRLIRVSFGPFQLGELAEGAIEEIKTRVLREQLGEELAAAAGVDFDAPVRAVPAPARRAASERASRPRSDKSADRGRSEHRAEREKPRSLRADRGDGAPAQERKTPRSLDRGPRRSVWRAEGRATPHYRRDRDAERSEGPDLREKRREETADRKGRRVVVERIVATPTEPRERQEQELKPRRERGEGERSFDKRGERPFRDRPEGDRPFKPRGDRPFRERTEGERPFKPRGERPFRERPEGDRPFKPRGERPFRERAEGDRPFKPRGKPPGKFGGKPFDKPRGSRPGGGRPGGPRHGGKPPRRPRGE